MNGISDAPWIRYADTNGVPPCDYDEGEEVYYAIVEELDGTTTRETFYDYDSALDFFKQCVEEGVISVRIDRCYGDLDSEILDYYEKEDD